MSRWLAVPTEPLSSPPFAGLSIGAKLVWLGLRLLHLQRGVDGVVPAQFVSSNLCLVAPGLLLGVDVSGSIEELREAHLLSDCDAGDFVALTDFVREVELPKCSRCKRPNPTPGRSRCPTCIDEDHRRPSRDHGERADSAQKTRRGSADNAQTTRRSGAETAQLTVCYPTPPHPTLPDSPTRALAREAPASPAGDPIRPSAPAIPGRTSPANVRDVASSWAVDLVARGVEKLLPIHVSDVCRLMTELGVDPPNVVDVDALARDRREAARRILAWCPQPERLASWLVVAVRRGAQDPIAYLRTASRRGDPGTLLRHASEAEAALAPNAERALLGQRHGAVETLTAGAASPTPDQPDHQRQKLRAELKIALDAGRRNAARRILERAVGADRSDLAVARFVTPILTLEAARELLEAAG